jgi:uncharacterized protein YaaQ
MLVTTSMNFGEVKSRGTDRIFTGFLVTGNHTDRCLYNGSKQVTGYSSKKAMAREAEVIPTGTSPDSAFEKAAEMMSDKGYEISTLEKHAEFEAKRNQSYYHYVSEDTIRKVVFESLQELCRKVKALEQRIESLEHKEDDYK